MEHTHKVISTKLLSGNPVVHIYSEENPYNGFRLVKPALEDVISPQLLGFTKKR